MNKKDLKRGTFSHRGSALLVVLGMLAFMMFSGLAYSVYMRATRLPSSFLRRTSASRQLAKAALAEAMEAIDSSIGNYLHPGIGGESSSSSGQNRSTTYANQWRGRVFLGNTNNLVATTTTQPVLTLEALAYLPPSLINDVRYFSQWVPSAQWHGFAFDSGRYAFVAVDVSDYFDVNRIRANKARSSAPDGRVTLAQVFESGADTSKHTSAGQISNASTYDTNLEQKMTNGGLPQDMPFVSMADYNLWWGSQTYFGVHNPFWNFMQSSEFYEGGEYDTSSEAEIYRGLTLISDNWFPTPENNVTKEGREVLDLAESENQPYLESDLQNDTPSLRTMMMEKPLARKFGNRLYNECQSFPLMGFAALYDYLDEDSVPLSLAIPTTERVPMVCGIRPEFTGVKFKINKEETTKDLVTTHPMKREVTRKYNLEISANNLFVKALMAYPFLKRVENDAVSVTLDGRVAFFLDSNSGNAKVPLRVDPSTANNDALYLKNDGATSDTGLKNKSVILFPIQSKGVTFTPTAQADAQDALQEVSLLTRGASVSGKILELIYEIEEVQDPGTGTWSWPEVQATNLKRANNSDLVPLTGDGEQDDVFLKNLSTMSEQDLQAGAWHKDLNVRAAVWVRVKEDSKTVDLVPACMSDDDNLNNAHNYSEMRTMGDKMSGARYPLLRFDLNLASSIRLDPNDLEQKAGQEITVSGSTQGTLYVSDPRYNHGPENWFSQTAAGDMKTEWENAASSQYASRDGDIFMFTSDQNYLQSIYELAFIPRFSTSGLEARGQDSFRGDYPAFPTTAWTDYANGVNDTKDSAFMWRSYDIFGDQDFDWENCVEPLGIVSGETGLRVNPFSDSTNVLMAALANTPADWRFSSTNDVTNPAGSAIDNASQFNSSYAWNGYGASDLRISWNTLELVAGQIRDRMRESNGVASDENVPEFEKAFWKLWQSDGNDKKMLAGVDLSSAAGSSSVEISSVDRRYFFGFWHDAFMQKPRQQLFLIFLRAEPMMMGGGVSGAAPPQLGARAVALVWRDPTETASGSSSSSSGQLNTGGLFTGGSTSSSSSSGPKPHRMRVLFYHQFD